MKLQNLSDRIEIKFYIHNYTLKLLPGQIIDIPVDIHEEEIEHKLRGFTNLYLIKDKFTIDLTQYDLNHNNVIDNADSVDGRIVNDNITSDETIWTSQKIEHELNTIENEVHTLERQVVNEQIDHVDGGVF